MILDQEVFVSDLVDESSDLFICFEEMVGNGIKLFPVIFNDNDGRCCLNLWYAKPSLGHNHFFVSDRATERLLQRLLFDAETQWGQQFMDSHM